MTTATTRVLQPGQYRMRFPAPPAGMPGNEYFTRVMRRLFSQRQHLSPEAAEFVTALCIVPTRAPGSRQRLFQHAKSLMPKIPLTERRAFANLIHDCMNRR